MNSKNLNETPEGIVYFYYKDENGKEYSIDFGSELKYNFDSKNNVLNVEKNINHIPFFYNEAKSKVIQNLSLIVGKNGSGKTTVLKEILNLVTVNKISKKFLIVYTLEGVHYYYSDLEIEFKIEKIDIIKRDSSLLIRDMECFNFIFLSNSFDYVRYFNRVDFNDNFFDLTTNGLIAEKYSNSRERLEGFYGEDPIKLYENFTLHCVLNFLLSENTNDLISFRRNKICLRLEQDMIEKYRTRIISLFFVDFIIEFNKICKNNIKVENIKIHSYLDKIREILFEYYRKNWKGEYMSLDENSDNLKKLLNIFDSISIHLESKNEQLLRELFSVLGDILRFIKSISWIESFSSKKINDSYRMQILTSIYFNNLSTILTGKEYTYIKSIKYDNQDSWISQFLSQIEVFFDNSVISSILSLSNDRIFEDDRVSQFEFILKNLDFLNDFYDFEVDNIKKEVLFNSFESYNYFKDELLKYNVSVYEIFEISFPQLSSGELALVNLFSRLYHLRSELIFSERQIVLFIDEADLYLHPQWQKQIISKFIEFCNTVFHDKKVQIIMTTNNAIPVSDVLKYNVVLLGQDRKQHLDNYRNTFGGNIFNLLNDTFFIQDGFIGEFAQSKIQELINILYKEDFPYLTKHMVEIENRINLIGEDLIRNKLLEILEQRLKANLISMKQDIDEIKDFLSTLKKEKKDE